MQWCTFNSFIINVFFNILLKRKEKKTNENKRSRLNMSVRCQSPRPLKTQVLDLNWASFYRLMKMFQFSSKRFLQFSKLMKFMTYLRLSVAVTVRWSWESLSHLASFAKFKITFKKNVQNKITKKVTNLKLKLFKLKIDGTEEDGALASVVFLSCMLLKTQIIAYTWAVISANMSGC